MKRQIHTMLVIAFVMCSCTSSVKQQQEQVPTADTVTVQVKNEGTVFHDITFGEAIEKAKQDGKEIFIDCYTQECGPCRQMSKQVFPQKECGEYMNANFICLKKDMQQDAEDVKYLNDKYNLKISPTFLVIDSDSTLICSLSGAILDTGRFIETVRSAISEAKAKLQEQEQ